MENTLNGVRAKTSQNKSVTFLRHHLNFLLFKRKYCLQAFVLGSLPHCGWFYCYKLFSNIQISKDFSHLELKAVIVLSWSARYPHHVVFMFLQNTNTWIIKPSGSCRASPHSALVGNQCCISKHTESWEPPPPYIHILVRVSSLITYHSLSINSHLLNHQVSR